MRGSRKLSQTGSNTYNFFLLVGWREDRNAIEMAFCWRADNGPPLNAGLFVIFRGSGSILLGNPIFL